MGFAGSWIVGTVVVLAFVMALPFFLPRLEEEGGTYAADAPYIYGVPLGAVIFPFLLWRFCFLRI